LSHKNFIVCDPQDKLVGLLLSKYVYRSWREGAMCGRISGVSKHKMVESRHPLVHGYGEGVSAVEMV
jgi:hypothetical protein